MKSLLIICIVILNWFPVNAIGQLNFTGEKPDKKKITLKEKGDYIVLGAFAIPNNALNFNERLHTKGLNTHLGFNDNYNLFYVYLSGEAETEKNISKVFDLRKNSEFSDAWLYRIYPESLKLVGEYISNSGESIRESKENELVKIKNSQRYNSEEIVKISERHEEETTEEEAHISEVDEEEIQRWDTEIYNEYKIKLIARDKENGTLLSGIVEAIDPRVHRLIHNLKPNKLQFLGVNKKTSQVVSLETDIFGYRRKIIELDLSNPLNDPSSDVSISSDTIIVRFDLEKHRKGDIFTMYKVFFHPDAAIMKESSSYELNKLLNFLKSSENYEVRLIGHTNGGGLGKIIKRGENTQNFFSIDDTNVESFGSAKKLSEERALTIKEWLVAQGIDGNRMKVLGMGGKFMLYEQDDLVRAKKNVRVEIEILKD